MDEGEISQVSQSVSRYLETLVVYGAKLLDFSHTVSEIWNHLRSCGKVTSKQDNNKLV